MNSSKSVMTGDHPAGLTERGAPGYNAGKMSPEKSAPRNSRQIAIVLGQRIDTGEFTPGQYLPPQQQLAGELGVHRRIIHEAIEHLAQEGRLVCRPRCRPLVPSSPAGSDSNLIALIMWQGGLEPRTTAQQRVFWGLNRGLSNTDYHVVFLDLGGDIESDEANAEREAARLQYVLDHRFAGIVFYPYAVRHNRDLIQQIARRDPLVLIDRQIPGIDVDYVGIDNFSAMREAAQHLLALGHTRIALVTGTEPINTILDRIAGYRAAMRHADPPAPDRVITVDSELEWSTFDQIVSGPEDERPSALLCVNDYIALRVAERLLPLGLNIPGDIALIGFDDLVQTLPDGTPLTSVAQPFEEIGATAARLLRERIQNPKLLPRPIELSTTLSIRTSTHAHSKSHQR